MTEWDKDGFSKYSKPLKHGGAYIPPPPQVMTKQEGIRKRNRIAFIQAYILATRHNERLVHINSKSLVSLAGNLFDIIEAANK